MSPNHNDTAVDKLRCMARWTSEITPHNVRRPLEIEEKELDEEQRFSSQSEDD